MYASDLLLRLTGLTCVKVQSRGLPLGVHHGDAQPRRAQRHGEGRGPERVPRAAQPVRAHRAVPDPGRE